jgi:putative oxidoreductase
MSDIPARLRSVLDAPAATDWAALFVRLALGWFFWAHLYSKFFTRDGFWGWWNALTQHQHHSAIVPIYVMTVEFTCAILLPLGVWTRLVALYALPSFAAIILFWLQIGGYWFTNPGAEFPIAWACLLVLQLLLGNGRFALQGARA